MADMAYLRKLFPHDITHEVSVTSMIVRHFFEGATVRIPFCREDGIRQYHVDINSATDPRFGGDFKLMYANDLADINDILLILKKENRYSLYVVARTDPHYAELNELFDSRRHVVLRLNTDDAPTQREELLASIKDLIISVSRDGQF